MFEFIKDLPDGYQILIESDGDGCLSFTLLRHYSKLFVCFDYDYFESLCLDRIASAGDSCDSN